MRHHQGSTAMRTMSPRSIIASACLGLLLVSGATAARQSAPPAALADRTQFEDTPNAALVYWRAWSLGPADFGEKTKSLFDAAKPVDPRGELATYLRENATLVTNIIAATRRPDCDFGIDYSAGFMAMMPHLAKLRDSARLLAADARLAAAEGRADDAAQRTAAIYRMARQPLNDRLMISSLVGSAIAGLGHSTVKSLADTGALIPAVRPTIRDAALALNTDDPFFIKGSVRCEGVVMIGWVAERCK